MLFRQRHWWHQTLVIVHHRILVRYHLCTIAANWKQSSNISHCNWIGNENSFKSKRFSYAWECIEESSTVFWMRNTVDDWIVDSVSLGEERSPDGVQWADSSQLEDTGEVDGQIWGPCHEPQWDGHEGNFGQTAFSWGCLSFSRSQWCNIHFFGLFAHVLFVSWDSLFNRNEMKRSNSMRTNAVCVCMMVRIFAWTYLHDVPVRVDDGQQWSSVDEETVCHDVWTALEVTWKVISTAGGHVAFWNVTVPAEDWEESPDKSMSPNTHDAKHSTSTGQWLGGQTFDDNIVAKRKMKIPKLRWPEFDINIVQKCKLPIEGNHNHSPDWYTAKQWSQTCIDLAHTCCFVFPRQANANYQNRNFGKKQLRCDSNQNDRNLPPKCQVS